MKRFLSAVLVLVCLLPFIYGGCGGGGSSGDSGTKGSGISYTGIRSEAFITQSNAEDIANLAFYGGSFGPEISVRGGKLENGKNPPSLLEISRVLHKTVNKLNLTSTNDNSATKAVVTISDTIAGECGGSFSYTEEQDDLTGDVSGELTFNNYCDSGIVTLGIVNYFGTFDLVTLDIIEYDLSIVELKYSYDYQYGYDSVTVKGNISFDYSTDPFSCEMDFLFRNESSKKVGWVNNYLVFMDEDITFTDMTAAGRCYHPDYGYVSISVSSPFRIYDGDYWPSDGVLFIEGQVGPAGENTKAQLIANTSVLYEIIADTNGDGVYNWSSGSLTWEGLN